MALEATVKLLEWVSKNGDQFNALLTSLEATPYLRQPSLNGNGFMIQSYLKTVSTEDRFNWARDNGHEDSYDSLVESLNESISMGDLTSDEFDEIQETWLRDRSIPEYTLTLHLFDAFRQYPEHPFDDTTLQNLAESLAKEFNFTNPTSVITGP